MPVLFALPLLLLSGYGIGRWKGDKETPLPVQTVGPSAAQLFGWAALVVGAVFAFRQIKKAW